MDGSRPTLGRLARLVVPGAALALCLALAWTLLRRHRDVTVTEPYAVTTPAPRPAAAQDLSPPAVRLVRAFPRLRFDRPVFLTSAQDGSSALYVVEQRGRVHRLSGPPDESATELFLDVARLVSQEGYEEGLLGLAFHPAYAANGRFFVSFTTREGAPPEGARFRVTEHRRLPDGRGDPVPGRVLLDLEQPTRFHHGGMLAFGPDGDLYVSIGDGDVGTNAQDLMCLEGAVLRLDVDRGGEGSLAPDDNPFTGAADARPEIWAYGFRNPWRFSFDRATGDLWLADVGSEAWEEINRVLRGGNYGWPGFEAVVHGDPAVTVTGAAPPVAAYARSEGQAVIGGYVYRGRSLPALVGRYVFGDFVRGRVWALTASPDAPDVTTGPLRTARGLVLHALTDSAVSLTSFGEGGDGELYASGIDGALYALVAGDAPPPFPELLSETGLFTSLRPLTPASGSLAYDVNVPLWADGASKDRFLLLPPGGRIGYREAGAWELPAGARLVKTFALPGRAVGGGAGTTTGRRLETRVIRRERDGWSFGTYAWNAEESEARLVRTARTEPLELGASGGTSASGAGPPSWLFMTEEQCRACHTPAAGGVLGLRTREMNTPGTAPDGVPLIDRWARAGVFDAPVAPAATLERLPALGDRSRPAAVRARGYLDANCSFCHRPGTTVEPAFDLRLEAPTEAGNLALRAVLDPAGLGRDVVVVSPGAAHRSALWLRMRERASGHGMPPLATTVPDEEALAVVGAWITGLDR